MARYCVQCGLQIEDAWCHCPQCGRAADPGQAPSNANSKPAPLPRPTRSNRSRIIRVCIIIAIAVIIIGMVRSISVGLPKTVDTDTVYKEILNSSPRPVTTSSQLGPSVLTLKPNEFLQVNFTILPGMSNASVQGRFESSGGSATDLNAGISALILNSENFDRWKQHLQVNSLYNNGNTESGRTLIRNLSPGSYVLIFANASGFETKAISQDFHLKYTMWH